MMHASFNDVKILYESENIAIQLLTLKAPILGFMDVKTMMTIIRKSPGTIIGFNTMLGMPVETTITITETRKDHSVFTMNYRFHLSGFRQWFTPLIKLVLRPLVGFFSARQWREDLPIKLRRQKILRLGFKDFQGLPDRIEDRVYDGPLECTLPVPRLKGSPVDAGLD